MKINIIRLIRRIDPTEGLFMNRWTASDARLIDLMVKLGLVQWMSDSTNYNPRWPRARHHGMRLTLSHRGTLLHRRYAR
ncbi:MAG: hypothetical protein EOO77_48025 [Oxalobacteraceae bacterium]|nr:MAG: hypothetical protein EOO77_48025 [Oxalobacteraceae bacterium]